MKPILLFLFILLTGCSLQPKPSSLKQDSDWNKLLDGNSFEPINKNEKDKDKVI